MGKFLIIKPTIEINHSVIEKTNIEHSPINTIDLLGHIANYKKIYNAINL